MNMVQVVGIISGLLAVTACLPYIRDIFKGDARPERASWFIWTVLAAIAFSSQLAQGAKDSLWFTGLDSLGTFVIFVLALRYGTGGFTRRDKVGLLVALFGLFLWYITRHASIALAMTILVDLSGAYLTVIKTYENPGTETYPMWVLISIAGILAMISVGHINIGLLAYPFYIFLANFAVVIAKFVGVRKR